MIFLIHIKPQHVVMVLYPVILCHMLWMICVVYVYWKHAQFSSFLIFIILFGSVVVFNLLYCKCYCTIVQSVKCCTFLYHITLCYTRLSYIYLIKETFNCILRSRNTIIYQKHVEKCLFYWLSDSELFPDIVERQSEPQRLSMASIVSVRKALKM